MMYLSFDFGESKSKMNSRLNLKGICFLVAFAISGFLFAKEVAFEGKGEIKTQTYEYKADKITIENISVKKSRLTICADVNLIYSNENKVCITAQENILSKIKVNSNNGKLLINGDKQFLYVTQSIKIDVYGSNFSELKFSNCRVNADDGILGKNVKLHLTGASGAEFKNCSFEDFYVSCSGASFVSFKTLKGDTLKASFSGAGKGIAENLELNVLECILSGASEVEMGGVVQTLNLNSSGASKYYGSKAVTQTALVQASGASDIHLNIEGECFANVSGASKIIYTGKGKVDSICEGAASVVRK